MKVITLQLPRSQNHGSSQACILEVETHQGQPRPSHSRCDIKGRTLRYCQSPLADKQGLITSSGSAMSSGSYNVLGLTPHATGEEIKQAYRAMVRDTIFTATILHAHEVLRH